MHHGISREGFTWYPRLRDRFIYYWNNSNEIVIHWGVTTFFGMLSYWKINK